MDRTQINCLLVDIIQTFIADPNTNKESVNILNKYLHIIMSQSQQAITFISCIEDEFDIEFDDDDIVIENLVDFLRLSKLIEKTVLGTPNKI